MLSSLAIRDVVLIDRLDLHFEAGLSVFTGETGAGKSILLDSLGLALGARAESGLVRVGAEQASVAAGFTPPASHAVFSLLHEHGIAAEDDLVLRRVVGKDGRGRAFVNDQPVSAALLKRVGAMLVEVQGQGDQMGLADPAMHGPLLDAFGVPMKLRAGVLTQFRAWRDADAALTAARTAMMEAERDQDFIRHAVDELTTLNPREGEEARLAADRHRYQQNERRVESIAAAIDELTPSHGRGVSRNSGPGAALRAAVRALQRLSPNNGTDDGQLDDHPAADALAALSRAEEALDEAQALLNKLANDVEADPRGLEHAEERLFALRAAARKHNVPVVELPSLLSDLRVRLAALETGEAQVAALGKAAKAARTRYAEACAQLSEARAAAAIRLDQAVARELPPLKLDRARFVTDIAPLAEANWGQSGADQVRFLIATNPGQTPGSLARVASGGELSRLMLALKVVLASASPVPTLVFDEVDSGIGGATAAAVGERLARVATTVQVLVVTHSPQVAARGAMHFRVSKLSATPHSARVETQVDRLTVATRREEIARMLAGETVTEAARAAADDLLGVS